MGSNGEWSADLSMGSEQQLPKIEREEIAPRARSRGSGAYASMEIEIPRLLSTAEAEAYLRYRTTSGIRNAVARGELGPFGAGPKGSHLFTLEELNRFVGARAKRYAPRRPVVPGDRGGGPPGGDEVGTRWGRPPKTRRPAGGAPPNRSSFLSGVRDSNSRLSAWEVTEPTNHTATLRDSTTTYALLCAPWRLVPSQVRWDQRWDRFSGGTEPLSRRGIVLVAAALGES